LKKAILFFFIISVSLLFLGLFIESENHQKYIGFGVLILFFIVFPLFSYHRWKDKKMEDYYLNNKNLKKFKENSNL
jgi:membrane protein YdbS with pleckstrin-like domain